MDPKTTEEFPAPDCPHCGEPMSLVGIERIVGERAALLTFECKNGHLTTTALPD